MVLNDIYAEIEKVKELEGVDSEVIGYSLLGRPIIALHIGSYEGKQVLIQGSIHAREYITSLLLIEQIKFTKTQVFDGGFYFIPLVNPDGVALVLEGGKSVNCNLLREYLIKINNNSEDFSLWKANAAAVDLNVNFDADWGAGRQNVFQPSSSNFVGYYAQSEREVNNLINFANKIKPSMTLSYHSRGEVIYYGFNGQTIEQEKNDLFIASNVAEVTGYLIEKLSGSVGGFKDWTTRHLGVPALTIEVGSEEMKHPIGKEHLESIFNKNKLVPIVAMKSLTKL